jgi:hypothetical protein
MLYITKPCRPSDPLNTIVSAKEKLRESKPSSLKDLLFLFKTMICTLVEINPARKPFHRTVKSVLDFIHENYAKIIP